MRTFHGFSRGVIIKTLRLSCRLSNLVVWEPQKFSIIQKITFQCVFFGIFIFLIKKFLKLLTQTKLPEDEGEFFKLLRVYFPTVFDIKYLMKSCKQLQGGLQDIADQMQIKRVGRQHQAGSDSLLTGQVSQLLNHLNWE